MYLVTFAFFILLPGWVTCHAGHDHHHDAPLKSRSKIWKYEQRCIAESPQNHCVYTSTKFANGRGVSVLATKPVAKHFESLSSFAQPEKFGNVHDFSAAPWEVKEIPGKGKGLFATKEINRGEVLLANFPVLVLNVEAFQFDFYHQYKYLHIAVDQLPPATQEIVMGLAAYNPGDPIMEVLNTNAFAAEFDGAPHFMLYPETSRMNHDCRPNGVYSVDERTLIQTTRAARKILPGEELTITYINPDLLYADRQQQLESYYGFKCSCSLCSQLSLLRSEARIEEIIEIQEKLADYSPQSRATPRMAERLIELYDEEGLSVATGTGLWLAAVTWCAAGSKRKAKEYADRAMKSAEEVPENTVDLEDLSNMLKGCGSHWSFGMRKGQREL